MKTRLILGGVVLLCMGLSAQIDPGATQTVKYLYGNLKEVAFDTKGILFGQEFFNSYSWYGGNHEDENRSDCKDVTGVHPAVLGQDFHYYLYKSSDEKRKHKEAALKAYQLGCVVTFDFHMKSRYHDGYDYQSSDRYLMYNIGNNNDAYGEVTWFKQQLDQVISIINNELQIPIVLRLFHEMNGNWFWWGTQAYGGSTAYINFYRFAVNYIKDRTNYVLFAWSPNYPWTTAYYPGNSYVDVVGIDMYDIGTSSGPSMSTMVDQLTAVSDFAWNNGKVPIFAETGNRVNSPDSWPWWWYNIFDQIQNSNRAWKIAWMLTWINTNWGNVPYVAHSGSSADAKRGLQDFQNMANTLFQPEAANRNMYDYSWRSSHMKIELAVDNAVSQNIELYPNPISAFDYLNIKSAESLKKVEIFDIQGRSVLLKVYNGLINNDRIQINRLQSGIYWVRINTENIQEVKRLVVQ